MPSAKRSLAPPDIHVVNDFLNAAVANFASKTTYAACGAGRSGTARGSKKTAAIGRRDHRKRIRASKANDCHQNKNGLRAALDRYRLAICSE